MKSYTLLEMGSMDKAVVHKDSAIFYARKYAQPNYLANYHKQGAEIYEQAGLSPKAFVFVNSIKETAGGILKRASGH